MTTRMRLFPLNAVLFPGAVLNLHVFEPRYKQLIAECLESGESFGVALIAEGAEAGDPGVTPHEIGAVAEIVEVTSLPFDRYYVSTIGRERFRICEVVAREPYLTAEVELLEEDFVEDAECASLAGTLRTLFTEYLDLLVHFSGRDVLPDRSSDAREFSFSVGDALQVGERIKQRLLEEGDTKERLAMERSFLERALPQMRRLVEQRQRGLEQRAEGGEDLAYRADQEKFFGKFFSAN
jgi:Lon protease-like protein